MSRAKRFPRPTGPVTGSPFATVAEAWIWAAQLQAKAAEGGKRGAGSGMPRPCEPGDIIAAAIRLHRARWLSQEQMQVLTHYGVLGRAPWPDSVFEQGHALTWDRALDRLAPVLQRRGIVLPPKPGRFGHVD